MLLAEGCSVCAYDPAAIERTRQIMPTAASLSYAESAYAAAIEADALLILTDWLDFAKLDLQRLNQTLRYPIVIDGRNLYEPATMLQHGFTYVSVGRGVASPARGLAADSNS